MSDSARRDSGDRIRREVLGDEYVDASVATATDFNQPLIDLVTEYCWGTIWSREGLSRRERSLINLAMLTALGRDHELAVHVRGAVRNGCSHSEIRETLLQAAVYCGLPAALDAFRTARSALADDE